LTPVEFEDYTRILQKCVL